MPEYNGWSRLARAGALLRRRRRVLLLSPLAGVLLATALLPLLPRQLSATTTVTGPGAVTVVLGGVVLGLLAGALLVWWRDPRDALLEEPEELPARHGLAVLGALPHSLLDDESVEAYRHLLHSLRARLGGRATVLVTGVGSGPDGEQVAEALARVTGRAGVSAVLVRTEPDPPGPEADLAYLRVPNLRVEDVRPGGAATLIRRPHLETLMAALRRGTGDGLVVLATPPTGRSRDAQAIAPHAHLTLLVAEPHSSRHAEIDEALRLLDRVGARDVAVVTVSSSAAESTVRGAVRFRRPVAVALLALAAAVTATVAVQAVRPPDPGDPTAGRQVSTSVEPAPFATRDENADGTRTVADVRPDGVVDVVERVVVPDGLDTVSLAPPPRPPGGTGTPRLVDLRLAADGEPVPVPGPAAILDRTVVRLPADTRVLELTYRVTGIDARSEPAPAGRVTLSLRSAVRSLPAGLDTVVEVRGGAVLSLVCPDAPPDERLCGLDQPGGWRTLPLASDRARVVALVDLPAT